MIAFPSFVDAGGLKVSLQGGQEVHQWLAKPLIPWVSWWDPSQGGHVCPCGAAGNREVLHILHRLAQDAVKNYIVASADVIFLAGNHAPSAFLTLELSEI